RDLQAGRRRRGRAGARPRAVLRRHLDPRQPGARAPAPQAGPRRGHGPEGPRDLRPAPRGGHAQAPARPLAGQARPLRGGLLDRAAGCGYLVEMRRGFALTEVLIVSVVLAVVGLPVLSLLFTGSREGALSEDFMFAETIASRFIEEWASEPFAKLDELVPRKVKANEESVPHRARLDTPPGFAAEMTLARVKDGLLALEVTV